MGDDGLDYEMIYTVTSTYEIPSLPIVTSSMLESGSTDSSGIGGKSYQDNDYVPLTGKTVDGKTITTITWTDDPQQLSETKKYQWFSKRDKIDGLWGAWYGSSSENTISKAAFYNNFGESAISYNIEPSTFSFVKNKSGNLDSSSKTCSISAVKDGVYIKISGVTVTSSSSNYSTSTEKTSDTKYTLTVTPKNLSSVSETITFNVFTENCATGISKSFTYSIVSDGADGDANVTMKFEPENIIVTQNDNKTLPDASSKLRIYDGVNEIDQSSLSNITYNITNLSELKSKLATSITLAKVSNETYSQLKISSYVNSPSTNTEIDVSVSLTYDGKTIVYNTSVYVTLQMFATFKETISGDVYTSVSKYVDNNFVSTSTFNQSNSAITATINSTKNDLSGKIESNYSTLSTNINGISGTVSSITNDISGIKTNVSNLQTTSDKIKGEVYASDGTTSRISSLETTASNLTTTVSESSGKISKLEQTSSSLTSSISSMGARRNLLVDSRLTMKYSNPTYTQSHGTYVSMYNSYSNAYVLKLLLEGDESSTDNRYGLKWDYNSSGGERIKLKSSTTYTLSFKTKRKDGYKNSNYLIATIIAYSDETTSSASKTSANWISLDSSKEWQTNSITFETGDSALYYGIKIEFSSKGITANKETIAYICQPMLEESSQYNGWSESDNDVIITKGNLLDCSDTFSNDGKLNSHFTHSGDTTEYYNTFNYLNTNSQCFYDMGSSDSMSEFRDLIWSGMSLSSYSDYTITFMARTNDEYDKNSDVGIKIWIVDDYGESPDAVDIFESTTDTNVYYSNSYTFLDLTQDWKKCTLHMRTGEINSLSFTIHIRMIGNKYNEYWIANPKMEIGVGTTDYISSSEDITNQPYYTESNISQTSDSITLAVNGVKNEYSSAGLKIKNGKVSISGNVEGNMNGTFNGTVSAKELAVIDNDGNAIIQFTELSESMKKNTTISSDSTFQIGMPIMIINYDGNQYITNLLKIERQNNTTTYKTNSSYSVSDSFAEETFYNNINTGTDGYAAAVTYYRISCSVSDYSTMPTYFTYINGTQQSGSGLCTIYSGSSVTNKWEKVGDLEELDGYYFTTSDALSETPTSTYETPIFRVDMEYAVNTTAYTKSTKTMAIAVNANKSSTYYATAKSLYAFHEYLFKKGVKSDKKSSILIGSNFSVNRSSSASLEEQTYSISILSTSSYYTVSTESKTISYINTSKKLSTGSFTYYAIATDSKVSVSDSNITKNQELVTTFNENKKTIAQT
jgi:archaellum component FlaC